MPPVRGCRWGDGAVTDSDLCWDLFKLASTVVFFLVFIAVLHPFVQPDEWAFKIMKGDLPDCGTTIGTDTGYYCQIDNVSYFCKVDRSAADPFVRNNPYCNPVVIV